MNDPDSRFATRSAFWASAAFYGLIVFEFFYMFSPFAVYLYGVYGPGLNLLTLSDSTSWLLGFFMPHIARETTSFFITWHEEAGMVLFAGGLAAFLIGAVQIYWSKLKRRGAVSGGIYRHIRHPQYLALMISGFGMVLIWPRYLVLFGFTTVCFAHYFLARLEEKICAKEFPGYASYLQQTGMFLPHRFERLFNKIPAPSGRYAKMTGVAALYAVLLFFSFITAGMVHSHSVNSVYTWLTPGEVYLSVGRLEPAAFEELIQTARADSSVSARLQGHQHPANRFINYVMPTDLYISEVPMYIPEGQTPSHRSPHREDQTRYKIIFSIADFGPREPSDGLHIVRRAIQKTPVLEVWIDRIAGRVEKILDPQTDPFYEGMPVPVF
ncbi:MAG: isoprenylcysteine carboxylmethyltransferase family protein [Balneolaceae bacterium]|nr:MAG: isoprenylcysteine carboxylmethyltransferase family protein [Balneolaceae bacterium]